MQPRHALLLGLMLLLGPTLALPDSHVGVRAALEKIQREPFRPPYVRGAGQTEDRAASEVTRLNGTVASAVAEAHQALATQISEWTAALQASQTSFVEDTWRTAWKTQFDNHMRQRVGNDDFLQPGMSSVQRAMSHLENLIDNAKLEDIINDFLVLHKELTVFMYQIANAELLQERLNQYYFALRDGSVTSMSDETALSLETGYFWVFVVHEAYPSFIESERADTERENQAYIATIQSKINLVELRAQSGYRSLAAVQRSIQPLKNTLIYHDIFSSFADVRSIVFNYVDNDEYLAATFTLKREVTQLLTIDQLTRNQRYEFATRAYWLIETGGDPDQLRVQVSILDDPQSAFIHEVISVESIEKIEDSTSSASSIVTPSLVILAVSLQLLLLNMWSR